MRRIIVGFDGGRESRDALRLGAAFANLVHAELIVTAVLDSPREFDTMAARYFDTVFDEARRELPDGDFGTRRVRGVSAPVGLRDVAVAEQAELIVIGSTHRGFLGRVVPGSVGERLLSQAPCAVAVAPRGFARGEHFGLGLVGVAFDGSQESEAALDVAERLAARLDARLRVITIVPRPASTGDRTLGAVLDDHGREIQRQASERVQPSADVEFALEQGDPVPSLARHGVDLDLLVTGSRGYGPIRRMLLGGVSGGAMQAAACPVLVVSRTALLHTDHDELVADGTHA